MIRVLIVEDQRMAREDMENYMAETENGFVAADGNMREIQFWAKDGTHVGAISTEDIFGVSYPWLEDMQLLDDGSLLIMLTQERDDGSANELMFFRLTGF